MQQAVLAVSLPPPSHFSFNFSLVSVTLPPCRLKLDAVWLAVVRFPIPCLAIATCHCCSVHRTHQFILFPYHHRCRVLNQNYLENCTYATSVLSYVFLLNGADRRTASTCKFFFFGMNCNVIQTKFCRNFHVAENSYPILQTTAVDTPSLLQSVGAASYDILRPASSVRSAMFRYTRRNLSTASGE